MLMLCGVIVGALFLTPAGTFALAILTGLAWNFLYTEPRFSINIRSASDVTMFVALLVASLSMGWLSNRLRRRGLAVARQQMHTTRLLEINTILTGAADTEDAVGRCLNAVGSLFNLPCAIQLRDEATHQLQPPHPAGTLPLDAKERGVAQWAFEKKQPAGRGTGTLPESMALHLPLQGRSFVMGVLSIDPGKNPLPLAERDLLAAIAAQLGLGLERNHLLHAIHHAEFLERGEQAADAIAGHALDTGIAAGTPPLVWLDADLLLAALGNLLANAGHHTPPGTPIHLRACLNQDSQLEIHVRDEGPGLKDPVRVFDRFHRGEDSRPGGLGLGLSIVRGLIRGLGGTSEARNTPGGGAEFILKIPVRTANQIPEIQ